MLHGQEERKIAITFLREHHLRPDCLSTFLSHGGKKGSRQCLREVALLSAVAFYCSLEVEYEESLLVASHPQPLGRF